MVIFKLYMQVYIVSGGRGSDWLSFFASTETLEKDGGSAWQEVAPLPSARIAVSGLGLDNGRFIVTGQSSSTCITKNMHCAIAIVNKTEHAVQSYAGSK